MEFDSESNNLLVSNPPITILCDKYDSSKQTKSSNSKFAKRIDVPKSILNAIFCCADCVSACVENDRRNDSC